MTIEDVEDDRADEIKQAEDDLKNKVTPKPKPESISPTMLKLMLKISDSPIGIITSKLSSDIDENFTVTEVTLEKMQKLELVKKNENGRWILSPKGKSLAINVLNNQKK
jgi:hypothetical protein